MPPVCGAICTIHAAISRKEETGILITVIGTARSIAAASRFADAMGPGVIRADIHTLRNAALNPDQAAYQQQLQQQQMMMNQMMMDMMQKQAGGGAQPAE